jgi:hypothetical protein
MALGHETVAAIRINADDLVPDEITRLLGATPAGSHAKGDKKTFGSPAVEYEPSRSGNWHLSSENKIRGD